MTNHKRATLKEVATRAGVSIATVSNVFSGRKPVNPDLRAKVEQAATELSYQVDRAASQLRSGRAQVVGVLVPDLDDTFFTSLVSRLEVMAQKDGYDVIVASSRDDMEIEEFSVADSSWVAALRGHRCPLFQSGAGDPLARGPTASYGPG